MSLGFKKWDLSKSFILFTKSRLYIYIYIYTFKQTLSKVNMDPKMQQAIIEKITEELESAYSDTLHTFKSKVQHALLALESDQVIQQMRNDLALEDFKLARARELLENCFSYERQLLQAHTANATLKADLYRCEIDRKNIANALAVREKEYAESLEDIQRKYTQFKIQVEMQATGTLKTDTQIQNLESLLRKERSNSDALSIQVKLLQSEVERLREQIQTKREQATNHPDEDAQRYQAVICKMKQDMEVIHREWEKRCSEIEEELTEQHRQQLQEARRGFQKAVDSKSVPRETQNEQLYRQKIREMKQACRNEVIELKEQYLQEIFDLKAKLGSFAVEQEVCKTQLINKNREIEDKNVVIGRLELQNREKESSLYKETQDLRERMSVLSERLKQATKTIYEREETIARLQKENEEQQYQHISELEALQQKVQSDVLGKQRKIEEELSYKYQQEMWQLKEAIKQKNNQLEQLQISFGRTENKFRQELEEKSRVAAQTELDFRDSIAKLKVFKDSNKRLRRILESTRFSVNRLGNEHKLFKEQLKYQMQIYRRKTQSSLMELLTFWGGFKQKMDQQNHQRMSQLLAQVAQNSQKQERVREKIHNENEKLKKQISDHERSFEEKLNQMKQESKLNQQQKVEKEQYQKELTRLAEKIRILEIEKVELHEQWQKEVKSFKKQVLRLVRNSRNDPSFLELVSKCQEQVRSREAQIQELILQVRTQGEAVQQLQDKCDSLAYFKGQAQQDLRQREVELESMLDRVDAEERMRKLAEKEMREMRIELQVKENTIQDMMRLKNKENRNNNNFLHKEEKERELEEIRAMIVKTYEVVGTKPESGGISRKNK